MPSGGAVGDFRTILQQIKEIRTHISSNDSATCNQSLQELDTNLTVVGGDVRMLGNEVFKRLDDLESRLTASVENAVKPLIERLDALEEQIRNRDVQPPDASSESPDQETPRSSKRRKIQRNPDLSHHVRTKLKNLGLSWDTSKKESDPVNVAVAEALLREVKEIDDVKSNTANTERRIQDAITSTYKTAKKRERRAESGKEEEYKQNQRRLQRIDRKLKRRIQSLNAVEKGSDMAEALHSSLISSDESEDELVTVRPLQWRLEELSDFFLELDSRHAAALTPSQKRMMIKRTNGEDSERSETVVPQSLQKWVKDSF